MKTLICIYSSHADLVHANQLKEYINDQQLNNCTVIIVLSDDSLDQLEYKLTDEKLYINVKECYTYLSIKTLKMLQACNQIFEYNILVKIDAGTMLPNRCYHKKEDYKICVNQIRRYINNNLKSEYFSHLGGGCTPSHNRAWMKQHKRKYINILLSENRDLNTEKVFTGNCVYKRGKFYIMRRNFVNYICNSEKAQQFYLDMFQHGAGSEDVSTGLVYRYYKTHFR